MVWENPFRTHIAEVEEQKIRQLEEAIAGRRCRKQVGFATFAEAAFLLPAMRVRAHEARRPRAEWRTEIESASAAGADTARLQGPSSSMPAAGWVSPIRLMRYSMPLDCIAKSLQISHQSVWEWGYRVFTTVG